MTCARTKHHPVSCGPDELCLSVVCGGIYSGTHMEKAHLSCGGDFKYCSQARPLSCMHIHHSPLLGVLCSHEFWRIFRNLLWDNRDPQGASQLTSALKRPHCPKHLQGAQAYVLWEPNEHLWQLSPWGRAIYTCARLPLYCLSYTLELEKTEEMEGVHHLQLCQQRLIAVVTSAVCSSEIWPETMENAIENLGRRKQA